EGESGRWEMRTPLSPPPPSLMLVHIIADMLHFILSKPVMKWQSYTNNNYIIEQAVDSPP
ncbi:MAG: hypothetical protein ABW185_26010, partial [Sedimenticola sp.]